MLVDTSLLVRTLQPHHELCLLAKKANDRFRLQNRSLYLVPQNLVEVWVVATRPVALAATPAIYQVWENLVVQ